MSTKWIPQALLEFVEFCRKWKAVLENPAYLAEFEWTPAKTTACLEGIDAFLAAFEAWQAVDSSMNKALMEEARKAAEDGIEHFAAYDVRFNEKMTEVQKLELLGVRTRHPGHPIDVPSTVPEFEVRPSHIRQIVLGYKDSGSERWGKPPKVHGIEIRWAILDHPPAGIGELTNSSFDTRHPFKITFDEQDRGKTVYFAGRWEIEREGQKGDFGPIVQAIIP